MLNCLELAGASDRGEWCRAHVRTRAPQLFARLLAAPLGRVTARCL